LFIPVKSRSNLVLGLVCLAFALVLLVVWIPLDTETGLIEKVRRRVVIGDALAPSVAAVFLVIGGVVLIIFERNVPRQPRVTAGNLRFIGAIFLILTISLVIMRYAGPVAVNIANVFAGEPLEYRLLRDTAPWKYIGYFLGGIVMIAGLISLIEGRINTKILLVSMVAVLALIAIYDLPFEDLLLPPNGDV
jgi:hypothetical protein